MIQNAGQRDGCGAYGNMLSSMNAAGRLIASSFPLSFMHNGIPIHPTGASGNVDLFPQYPIPDQELGGDVACASYQRYLGNADGQSHYQARSALDVASTFFHEAVHLVTGIPTTELGEQTVNAEVARCAL